METQPKSSEAFERNAELAIRAAHEAGVPADQLRNFLQAGVVLQPRQWAASAAARSCDREDGPLEIGYGGARGGGKSHWMLAQMGADDCQRVPGLKCLLLRKVGSAVKEAMQDLRQKTLRGVPHEFKEAAGILKFPNGSQIILGHFKDEKDVDKYLGLEYDVIGVEEATTLTASKYRMIRTCNRTSKANWRPRMYSTTNPGGLGHSWYKALFVEPHRTGKERDTRFIPATVRDNGFINADYRRTLETLTGWQRRAWLDGDWDIAAGQYFVTFRREHEGKPHHVIPIIKEIPKSWNVWMSMDYGFTHWNMFYLLAQDGDGNLYALDEYGARQTLVPSHVGSVNAMLKRNGIEKHRLSAFVAGHDVFAQRHDGETTAKKYKDEGFTLTPAITDRINGATEILARLGDVDAKDEDGNAKPIPPRFFITERCTRLIECIPTLQHDPNNPEDVLKWDCDEDGAGGDDAYDGARYGVMAAKQTRYSSSFSF